MFKRAEYGESRGSPGEPPGPHWGTQVLPDIFFSKQEPGDPVTREEQESWELSDNLSLAGFCPQATLLQPGSGREGAKGKGKGTARQPTKRTTDQPRMASFRILKCLDALLERTQLHEF